MEHPNGHRRWASAFRRCRIHAEFLHERRSALHLKFQSSDWRTDARSGVSVPVYFHGEMVVLLQCPSKRLSLWNNCGMLRRPRSILKCFGAYPRNRFNKATHSVPAHHRCDQHSGSGAQALGGRSNTRFFSFSSSSGPANGGLRRGGTGAARFLRECSGRASLGGPARADYMGGTAQSLICWVIHQTNTSGTPSGNSMPIPRSSRTSMARLMCETKPEGLRSALALQPGSIRTVLINSAT